MKNLFLNWIQRQSPKDLIIYAFVVIGFLSILKIILSISLSLIKWIVIAGIIYFIYLYSKAWLDNRRSNSNRFDDRQR